MVGRENRVEGPRNVPPQPIPPPPTKLAIQKQIQHPERITELVPPLKLERGRGVIPITSPFNFLPGSCKSQMVLGTSYRLAHT